MEAVILKSENEDVVSTMIADSTKDKDIIDRLIQEYISNSMVTKLSPNGIYTYCIPLVKAVDILKGYQYVSYTNKYPLYVFDALIIDMVNAADFLQARKKSEVISLVSAVEILKRERECERIKEAF